MVFAEDLKKYDNIINKNQGYFTQGADQTRVPGNFPNITGRITRYLPCDIGNVPGTRVSCLIVLRSLCRGGSGGHLDEWELG